MPRRLPDQRRRRTALRLGSAALTAALVVPLSACSGDDEKPAGGEESAGTAAGTPGVRTDAALGTVVGILPKANRARVTDGVAAAIDSWWDAAYVGGEYPRSRFPEAFAGFTPRAAARARGDLELLSNAGLGRRLTTVRAIEREVVVDLLAVQQRPCAATARVVLVLQLDGKGGLDRRDRIAGRVLLTRDEGRWRVFGYDLRRETIR